MKTKELLDNIRASVACKKRANQTFYALHSREISEGEKARVLFTVSLCHEMLDYLDTIQLDEPEVDLEEYISNKLRELGADLINHKPFSFNRGLNVGMTKAYADILEKINARKEIVL